MTAGTGQPKWDRQKRTARTGQPKQDSQYRTVRREQPEQASLERTARTTPRIARTVKAVKDRSDRRNTTVRI